MDNYDGVDIKNRQYKIITPNKTQSKHIGRKFKELTAITPVIIVNDDTVKNPTGFRSWWLFQCSCGNKICKQFPCVANNQKLLIVVVEEKNYMLINILEKLIII